MDPTAQRLEKARGEIALLSLMGMLLIPVALSLFLADSRIDAKAMALMIVRSGFFLPVLMLKGFMQDVPRVGTVVAALLAAAPAYVATWQVWIASVALVCGAVGGMLFYRIRSNTSYRPRLRGE